MTGAEDQIVQAHNNQTLGLQIVDQPPEKAVYKRNVKPNPSVQLVGEHMGIREGELYVVPLLLRCDTYPRSFFFSMAWKRYSIFFIFFALRHLSSRLFLWHDMDVNVQGDIQFLVSKNTNSRI